ncbi:hypothetical protein [Methylobacterium sp. E-046]|uniref:hypothetical protein n=1 Tax=Methylobacterium sp. E-046 TaxID=2836576 RepID=UPI001FBA95F5|nr:hypothetical protein [Methylobacterium sp. E-046]MCJ2101949.1 hypothetical protein [Methylobacterium sp. E-046]
MSQADTLMPGEDPGALIEDPSRLDEIESPKGDGSKDDPTSLPTPNVPEEDDPAVRDTEQEPT